jgi:glyoxylase-like metal-dependent hydrolase (beta-lactamase superfamily II)
MLSEITEVLHTGDARGNGMAVRIVLPSGVTIFGFATRNFYGGDWDYGPTWNYLVCGDDPFLVDTGRHGMGHRLLDMVEGAGISPQDIYSVVVSHGHEDHDGGLHDVVTATGATVRAHPIYERLLRFSPEHAPTDFRNQFPASCWRCFMPKSFAAEHCLDYQRERSTLRIEPLGEGPGPLAPSISVHHLPGHTPDSVALLIGDEALLVGDVVLAGITPFPSCESFFEQVRPVLPQEYDRADLLYGVRAYLRSIKKLGDLADCRPGLLVLPGHRLYFDDRWHDIDLGQRVNELIEHHLQRCADVLSILEDRPMTAREIASRHFENRRLDGLGMSMAENEILSHCELLVAAGDVVQSADDGFEATGTQAFAALVENLEAA